MQAERLMTVGEVADYLVVPVPTLYQWRHKGTGPAAMRVGRHLRYRRRDVEEWLDRQQSGYAEAASSPM